MNFAKLLQEKANYDAQLMGDINAYLISLKANDIPSVQMDMMVRELNGMGYSVNAESMVDLLSNSNYISKVTTDTIDLVHRHSNKNDDADKKKVRKLAVKTAKKKVKK
ncbi:uncharacterized protein METZ01_LOCUS454343 [marine metagenome]|uniref:Uncharacterized protein n=1 Tax=marine metagenome TaxID=408172 RepID=A0A383A1P8_9ZZZZ